MGVSASVPMKRPIFEIILFLSFLWFIVSFSCILLISSAFHLLQRAKKVFDPSEGGLGVPGRKKAVYRCDVCYQTVNQHSVQEDLLVCHRCSARGQGQPSIYFLILIFRKCIINENAFSVVLMPIFFWCVWVEDSNV